MAMKIAGRINLPLLGGRVATVRPTEPVSSSPLAALLRPRGGLNRSRRYRPISKATRSG